MRGVNDLLLLLLLTLLHELLKVTRNIHKLVSCQLRIHIFGPIVIVHEPLCGAIRVHLVQQ
jgi:hypothetical protein